MPLWFIGVWRYRDPGGSENIERDTALSVPARCAQSVQDQIAVAIARGIQKLFSAIFIFLFGLAVRNMLKVK
jgi:hypothetical protein